jgi:hypothetical protein
MSNAESFIEEVSEEVRRDRLYALLKRYGWIAVLLIVLVVGGAAWSEWTKAKTRAAAENLGDAMLAALELNDSAARVTALKAIAPEASPNAGQPVLDFMLAAQQADAEDAAGAAETLNALAVNGEIPEIYRQIAAFKALGLSDDSVSPAEKRSQYEALAQPGAPLRLLAMEQLALLDVQDGEIEAAIAMLQSILDDAQVSSGLQQRASQVIVALGGTPKIAVPANG